MGLTAGSRWFPCQEINLDAYLGATVWSHPSLWGMRLSPQLKGQILSAH